MSTFGLYVWIIIICVFFLAWFYGMLSDLEKFTGDPKNYQVRIAKFSDGTTKYEAYGKTNFHRWSKIVSTSIDGISNYCLYYNTYYDAKKVCDNCLKQNRKKIKSEKIKSKLKHKAYE